MRATFLAVFQTLQTVGNLMERLIGKGVDRHLRNTEQARVIERPDLHDHRGKPCARVTKCVPHSAQNSRVTGRSRSLRLNCFGAPLV